jgi:nitrite reductase/ring-hydroxylating ferredoxin subunit/uncharacterized membrane protein
MALERRRIRVGARERIERNRTGLDRWMEEAGWLDRPSAAVQAAVLSLFVSMGEFGRGLKTALHGTRPLGHPLHAGVVSIPIGAFTVMVLGDWLGLARAVPGEVGSFGLVVGILGMLVAAASGLTDHTGTAGKERRYASVHGLVMSVVLLAMLLSLLLRYQPGSGIYFGAVLLSTFAYALMVFGSYLGGHLSFAFATMVNHNALRQGTTEWTTVGDAGDFAEGRMVRVMVGDMPALVVRLGGRLSAISASCSHAGGPLDEGTLRGDVVTCPWHGSRFCVSDGHVEDGPATFSQPALLVVEEAGKVRLRMPS